MAASTVEAPAAVGLGTERYSPFSHACLFTSAGRAP